MLTASNIILILLTLLNLSLGAFVLKKSPKNSINISYFLFALGISSWTVTNAIFQATDNYFIAFYVCILAYYAGALIALPFFYFTLVFPAGYSNLKTYHKWIIAIIIVVWDAVISIPNLTLKGVSLDGPVKGLITGPGLNFHLLATILFLLAGIINLLIKYKKVKGVLRWQISYILLGVFTMTFFGAIFNLILPAMNNYSFVWLGPIFSSFVLVTTAYAIVRYHLMDIYFIFRLGTIYTTLFAFVALIYAFINKFVGQYFQEPWEYIVSALVITFSFAPLKNFIEITTDKIFFKKHYKFSEVINTIENGIRSAGLNLDKALEKINEIITASLKVKKAVVLILIPKDHFISRQAIGDESTTLELKRDNAIISYLKTYKGRIVDKEELKRNIHNDKITEADRTEIINELDKINFSLVVPIESKGQIIGIYLLGEKLSYDPFTKEDISLLRHVSWMMGFSIDNAKSFEELKRVDRAKSEFISVASHQLRTPISIALWSLELYLDGKMSAKDKKKTVETAYSGVTSLQCQLDQLLVALEIEEQRMSLKTKPIDLNSITKDMIKKEEDDLKNKKIKLKTDLSGIARVDGDEEKMKVVIGAILKNAITYTPGGGEICVNSYNKKIGGKNNIVFSISDNGIGIREDEEQNIFTKFFRSVEAKTMSPNGFGLTLFIAKKIIEAHNGDIWFERNKEKGTIFYLSIPVNEKKK